MPALLALLLLCLLGACGRRPLPFPTPAQHDLVVLIQEGPLTYARDDQGNVTGLERDLIEAFAQDLGVGVRYLQATPQNIESKLSDGEAHFAAGWFSPAADEKSLSSSPFLKSRDVLVQNDASLPVTEKSQLAGRTVHVMPGSRQAAMLHTLRDEQPDLQVREYRKGGVFDLLQAVGEGTLEMAFVDSAQLDIAMQFVPSLQATLPIGPEQPVVWRFASDANPELRARVESFLERSRQDGTLARLRDRYLGHVQRLSASDIARFMERIETVLPKLRTYFFAAQAVSSVDWRLVAAIAYQESHWDANATSPTGVRGIMMLTEETADRLGVSNRLDPRESILAGARYLDFLKSQMPASTPEPDRTWLAISAYNIGPGHFNAARNLAKQLKANPDSWYEMKRILPLLAQPQYYQRLKSGRARGGEAVILTENIRSYYQILARHEAPYKATGNRHHVGLNPGKGGPGLKPRH